MTSEHHDNKLHEFLVLSWIEMDFIINRNQFSASVFLQEEMKYQEDARYFSSLMTYNGQTLPVFNFNAFLTDTFRSGIHSNFNIALICDISLFSRANQSSYRKHFLKNNTDISSQFLAVKVSVHAGMNHVPLSEINLIPPGLRGKLNNEGILGCRFTNKNNIQYFVDIETIIFKCIREKGDFDDYQQG
jgi:hypothetical protein